MPDFNVVPMNKTLLVEGAGRKEPFRGLVIAIGWYEDQVGAGVRRKSVGGNPPPDLHYLVSDESKPAPIWAEARHITSQQWFPLARAGAPAS
ncbi:MAG: hypothetical protein QOI91_1528 [Solirubrobacteraceae bacterium]|jgi:hypothetical protein|nr:hypothetical protein [Solirubrobacteraceae bacterium]